MNSRSMRVSLCPTNFATHARSNGESPNDADGLSGRFAVSSAVQLGIIILRLVPPANRVP